jgi:F-type H+-transporting ATPase subunit a
MFASGFTFFQLIPAIDHDTLLAPVGIHEETWLVFMAWFVCALVITGGVIARMGLEKAKSRPGLDAYLADAMPTPRTLAEVLGGALYGLFKDILGDADARAFFPYLGSLFVYLLCSNAIGAIPGFMPPTENLNNNVGMAVIVFLVFNFVGFSRAPIGYIKHLLGPVSTISPSAEPVPFLITLSISWLIFIIEVFGLVLRPFTLTVRISANMTGDHAVFGAMSDLFPYGVPAIFIGFGLFVSFIQAFVFTLLTTIYISLSKPHDDHDEGHGEGHDHDHDQPGHDHAHAHH